MRRCRAAVDVLPWVTHANMPRLLPCRPDWFYNRDRFYNHKYIYNTWTFGTGISMDLSWCISIWRENRSLVATIDSVVTIRETYVTINGIRVAVIEILALKVMLFVALVNMFPS